MIGQPDRHFSQGGIRGFFRDRATALRAIGPQDQPRLTLFNPDVGRTANQLRTRRIAIDREAYLCLSSSGRSAR